MGKLKKFKKQKKGMINRKQEVEIVPNILIAHSINGLIFIKRHRDDNLNKKQNHLYTLYRV